MKGVQVNDLPSQMMIGAEVRAQLDGLVVNTEGGGFVDMVRYIHGRRSRVCGGSSIWLTFFFHIILI